MTCSERGHQERSAAGNVVPRRGSHERLTPSSSSITVPASHASWLSAAIAPGARPSGRAAWAASGPGRFAQRGTAIAMAMAMGTS